ncbi:hypothetical protein [Hydrogenophaga sp.]|uniref:hypothetical protein n=1 Tax=Hydrogenophaga sp. TaxID=1904254 RepID=UPI0025C30D62|nr:hypothetical protein [Hydrogenophaga sp.]MBT9463715.1 hypothetical protein [Hydrogenophaga sp.]
MNSTYESKKIDSLLLLLVAISSVATLAWMLNYSRYGIDFTDEGLYLIWAANPHQYDASVTQFGFIHHPLYLFLNGNIAHMRQFNVGITFGLAFLLCLAVFEVTRSGNIPRFSSVVSSLGLATASLVVFSLWLVTPSYNSLNLHALLISAVGIVWSSSSTSRLRFAGLIVLGIGGWLSFMAKPSTAMALGMLVVIYWATNGKLRLKDLVLPIAVAGALLLLTAWVIDGSVLKFKDRISTGLEVARLLGGGHSIEKLFRLDEFSLNDFEHHLFAVAAVMPLTVALALGSAKTPLRLMGIFACTLPVFYVGVVISETGSHASPLGSNPGLLFLSLSIASALYVAFAALARQHTFRLSPDRLALALLLLTLPYCYAFGTNGNYWWSGAFAGFFWLLPGLVLVNSLEVGHDPSRFVALLAITTTALTMLILDMGMQTPYRQPQPLTLNDQVVEVGQRGSNLVLSESYVNYLQAAKGSAGTAGLAPGTPMIDLSGQSPGILYALGAESLGQAWMIGGYPGSANLASFVLKAVPCEKLGAAWILAEPDGPRSLPGAVLATFGASLATDYVQVGSWATAAGAGGYTQPREQTLWKPARDKGLAAAACRAARTGTAQ